MKTGSLREIIQAFSVVWVVEPCQIIVLFLLDTVHKKRKKSYSMMDYSVPKKLLLSCCVWGVRICDVRFRVRHKGLGGRV